MTLSSTEKKKKKKSNFQVKFSGFLLGIHDADRKGLLVTCLRAPHSSCHHLVFLWMLQDDHHGSF
jgi:hypothetical protein